MKLKRIRDRLDRAVTLALIDLIGRSISPSSRGVFEARHTPTRAHHARRLAPGSVVGDRRARERSRSIDRVAGDPRAARPVTALASLRRRRREAVAEYGASNVSPIFQTSSKNSSRATRDRRGRRAPLESALEATMKHGKTFRKLGRDSAHRWAMMRTMVTQLIEHERIKTTVAKAKELRKVADRVVTYAKRARSARGAAPPRSCARTRPCRSCSRSSRRGTRAGRGVHARVLQTGQRKSDSAQMAFIEYVDREGELRPARPAAGLGLSWAAKEYVQRQLAEERNARGRSKGETRGAAEPVGDGIPPL